MSTEPTRTEFSQEASDRLRTLSDEIQARLDEIGQIVSTATGEPLDPGTRVKFVPKNGKTFGDHPVLIEILDMPDGTTCCAVWTDAHGSATLYCPC